MVKNGLKLITGIRISEAEGDQSVFAMQIFCRKLRTF